MTTAETEKTKNMQIKQNFSEYGSCVLLYENNTELFRLFGLF